MSDEPATVTYSIAEPFEKAVKSLRKALEAKNLRITGESDMSGRIRRSLLIGSVPCRILLVSAKSSGFAALGGDSCAAALTPLHVVVSARGLQTEIHILRVLPAASVALDQPAAAAFRQAQTELAQAIEKIGMRSTLGV